MAVTWSLYYDPKLVSDVYLGAVQVSAREFSLPEIEAFSFASVFGVSSPLIPLNMHSAQCKHDSSADLREPPSTAPQKWAQNKDQT